MSRRLPQRYAIGVRRGSRRLPGDHTPRSSQPGQAGLDRGARRGVRRTTAWFTRPRSGWLWAAGLALALPLGALLGQLHFALLRQPADFSIYYAAARVLASGGDPYNWHALQRIVPGIIPPGYVYPLWGLLPALAVAWLPLPVAAGVWLAGSCCCLVYAIWGLGQLAGLSSRSLWLPALLGSVCLSIPGLFVLIQGQVSLLLLAALVGAYAALRDGQPRWAGVLLALALAKPQLTLLPVLALAFVGWRARALPAVARWAGGALAALVALSFAVRPGWLAGWLAALDADAGAGGTGSAALRANMGTVPALAAHLPPFLGILLIGVSVAAGAWLFALLARRLMRVSTSRAALELLAAAICVGTVLSPWMWIYDGVFWLVALVALVRWAEGWRRWLGIAVFWALPWAVRLVHVAGSARGGTSLNKLEDVLVAPLLLALLFVPVPRLSIAIGPRGARATPGAESPSAIQPDEPVQSARTAASAARARRPTPASPRRSRRG